MLKPSFNLNSYSNKQQRKVQAINSFRSEFFDFRLPQRRQVWEIRPKLVDSKISQPSPIGILTIASITSFEQTMVHTETAKQTA
jgi:hypothetical protein